MRLHGDEDSFGRCDAARAGEAVCERYMSGRRVGRMGRFGVEADFIFLRVLEERDEREEAYG